MDALRFAATKIQPPRTRSTRIARPSLEAALREAVHTRRVVLLVAPAGFGKTSALAALLAAEGGDAARDAIAWVSLDEDDDTPRLFACLAAALEPFDLPWRTAPDALAAQVGDAGDGARRALVELVNALAGAEVAHGTIVLDDLHRVQSPPLHGFLDALIERLPASWTLVLASRAEPPLALARLRVADELAEFGEAALRFSAEESGALVAAEPASAVRERAAELFERTQGWPAGLRLCIAALRQRPALAASLGARGGVPGVDRHLFDYLAAEVLDDMPLALHDFLLRCAVLPALTASRAAAVSGDPRAAQWLDEIERRGLFVSTLDAAERTLVLHDLFRDALDDRLRRRLPGELPGLLRRAAATEADPVRRVGYLLRAADWAQAEAALAHAAPELFLQGAGSELQRLVDQFPDDWRRASPVLLRLRGVAHSLRWQWDDMARDMQAAEQAALGRGDDAERWRAQAYRVAALHAIGRADEATSLLASLRTQPLDDQARLVALLDECTERFDAGDTPALAPLYGELVERLERVDSLQAWWECTPAMSWSAVRGMRPLLERYGRGVLQRLGDRELPLRGLVHSQRAYLLLWAGRVDEALAAVAVAEADVRWLACSTDIEANTAVLRLLVDAMQGHAARVRDGLAALLHREDGSGSAERARYWQHVVAVFGVRLTEVLGRDPQGLRHWGSLMEVNPLELPPGAGRPSALVARLAAAEARWEDAAQAFLAVLPGVAGIDQMGQMVDLHLRAAHALLRCGRLADAAQAAAPALLRMVDEGDRGHALMCGPEVLSELAAAAWGDLLRPQDVDALRDMAALAARLRQGDGAPRPAASHAGSGGAVADALSEREREVLERIAAGSSNKLIARALDISPHTVKRHVANILDKLALASRGQAAAWWRAQSRP